MQLCSNPPWLAFGSARLERHLWGPPSRACWGHNVQGCRRRRRLHQLLVWLGKSILTEPSCESRFVPTLLHQTDCHDHCRACACVHACMQICIPPPRISDSSLHLALLTCFSQTVKATRRSSSWWLPSPFSVTSCPWPVCSWQEPRETLSCSASRMPR